MAQNLIEINKLFLTEVRDYSYKSMHFKIIQNVLSQDIIPLRLLKREPAFCNLCLLFDNAAEQKHC